MCRVHTLGHARPGPFPPEAERVERSGVHKAQVSDDKSRGWPGLICLGQIKGRHRLGFEEWMQLDLFYIDHWSLKLDFLIICRTVATVPGGTGV